MTDAAFQRCIDARCGATYDLGEALYACRACGSLLDVAYDWSKCRVPDRLSEFSARRSTSHTGSSSARADFSGVWRFRELLPFAKTGDLVTLGEGRTILQPAHELAGRLDHKPSRLFLQYEGFNPSGSFKDSGMCAAMTVARRLGRSRVACASTGNTSASLALYAGLTRTASGTPIEGVVFVGGGKIAFGKLAQTLDYGATTIQIDGDFDACMELVQTSADRLGLYLVNSVNPFRLEGQKTIMYRVLEGLGWNVPDWIVVPGGNLGNSSAFGKAFIELKELGLIDRLPRLAIINADGANTLSDLVNDRRLRFDGGRVDQNMIDTHYARMAAEGRAAKTVASAIEIARPVNLVKALRSLEAMNGVVRQVSDDAILDAKALVGRFGYGCEPASAASVAGVRLLKDEGVIAPSDVVVCILTGHALKDPNVTVNYHGGEDAASDRRKHSNSPLRAAADVDAVARLLEGNGNNPHE